jgi:hypothetical protein
MEMQKMMEFFRKQLRADREDYMAKMDAKQERMEADHKEFLARL